MFDIFAIVAFTMHFPNIPSMQSNDASRTLDAHGLRISMLIRKPTNHAYRAGTESVHRCAVQYNGIPCNTLKCSKRFARAMTYQVVVISVCSST